MQNLGNKSKVTAIIAIVLLMASAMFVTMQVKPAQGLPPPSATQPYIGALHPGDYPNASDYALGCNVSTIEPYKALESSDGR